MIGDGSHTDLIAQIADGDVRHALRAQQVPKRLALGLQRGHIQPHRVVVHAQRIGAAGFHRNHGGGLAGCQRGSLRRGGGFVLGKRCHAHAQGQLLHRVQVLVDMQPHDGSAFFDCLYAVLRADDDRFRAERQNQRPRQ